MNRFILHHLGSGRLTRGSVGIAQRRSSQVANGKTDVSHETELMDARLTQLDCRLDTFEKRLEYAREHVDFVDSSLRERVHFVSRRVDFVVDMHRLDVYYLCIILAAMVGLFGWTVTMVGDLQNMIDKESTKIMRQVDKVDNKVDNLSEQLEK
jgi:Fe2+ transport system protein B